MGDAKEDQQQHGVEMKLSCGASVGVVRNRHASFASHGFLFSWE